MPTINAAEQQVVFCLDMGFEVVAESCQPVIETLPASARSIRQSQTISKALQFLQRGAVVIMFVPHHGYRAAGMTAVYPFHPRGKLNQFW